MDDLVLPEPRVPLPAGRLMTADPSMSDETTAAQPYAPVFWMSERPVGGEVWAACRAEHPRSGLWPLLLLHDLRDGDGRPWEQGELTPTPVSAIDGYDVADFMVKTWAEFEELETFRRTRPGLAAPGVPVTDPDEAADRHARLFDGQHGHLGLVPAARGADALTAIGWTGPCNHSDMPPLSAVLRSWESRFGARVVAVGFATLYLSVAAPPSTVEHALHVAAEHFAFCPDNIQQGGSPYTLEAYARELVGVDTWAFWWD
ncbi:DUF4253 domain-containing protein [Streptosporangium sp. NPDC020072]|uniref:DUF4253 domain-containing protein n=1 Tax=Streptosporangium sp. NPDC020072 TaxID=3154788 RepID=UPI003415B076